MRELRERRFILQAIFGTVLLLMCMRLFYLQVLSPDFAAKADQNAIKRIVLEPQRGVIYDRNGRIYVTNSPIFDLNIVPEDLVIPDSAKLAAQLRITRDELSRRVRHAARHNRKKTQPLATQINADVYAALQEHLWATKGISTMVRNSRNYLYPVGANFLGYISEVDKKDIERSASYYTQGDQIGRSGLERQYEHLLRGRKGVRMVMVDVHGREVGPFAEGQYDTIPVKGQDVMVTVDAELQLLGEALMQNKLGSIVAIEPSSGEILSFISSPGYDPNLLTGMEYGAHYRTLVRDSLLPLYNRPLQAMYPPGSVFKLLNAIVALSAGSLSEHTTYGCVGGFPRNGGRPKCHAHPSPLNLEGAIQHSCNAYFAATYVDMLHSSRFPSFSEAFNFWYESMSRFGVGHRVGVDIPNEKPGLLPSAEKYNKWYGKNRWFGMTIVSNSIGQGEVLMTPLQMANVTAIIANRGYYVQPHFLKNLYPEQDKKVTHFDTIRMNTRPEHFRVVVDGMERVMKSGTGYYAQVPGISICGKTGTAENPHGDDHSVFVAFAPKDNPKIAIAVIVENSGFGATWAAPIASLMIEQYLTGRISNEARLRHILDANLLVPKKQRFAAATTATTDPAARPLDKRAELIRQAALAALTAPGNSFFAEQSRKASEQARAAGRQVPPVRTAAVLKPAPTVLPALAPASSLPQNQVPTPPPLAAPVATLPADGTAPEAPRR